MRRRCCQSLKRIQSIPLTGLTVLAMSGWRTAQRQRGTNGRESSKLAQEILRSIFLPRSILLRRRTDDSHITLRASKEKETKPLLARSAQMVPGDAQGGVAARMVLGTSSARPPAASDSKARRPNKHG